MIKISEPAINRLMPVFTPIFSTVIMDVEIPSISSSGLDTQPSYFDSFEHDDLVFVFNETDNSLLVEVSGVSGSINAFDFVAKQSGIFTEMKCRGNTAPQFTNWTFSLQFQLLINGSCQLEIMIDDDAIEIIPGDLSLNFEFENGLCNTVMDTVEKSVDLEAEVSDLMVNQLPPMMSRMLKREVDAMLPSADLFEHQDFGLQSNGTIDICYMLTYMEEDRLIMGIDFVFDGKETERSV